MTWRGSAPGGTGTVYALTDPRDHRVRYVGAALQPLGRRLQGHLSHPAVRVGEWLEGLREDGLVPEIAALREDVPARELRSAEAAEINRAIVGGDGLLNREAAYLDSQFPQHPWRGLGSHGLRRSLR